MIVNIKTAMFLRGFRSRIFCLPVLPFAKDWQSAFVFPVCFPCVVAFGTEGPVVPLNQFLGKRFFSPFPYNATSALSLSAWLDLEQS